jgi:hypothetical protein
MLERKPLLSLAQERCWRSTKSHTDLQPSHAAISVPEIDVD